MDEAKADMTGGATTEAMHEDALRMGRVLKADMAAVDDFVCGFRSSQVTLFDSDSDYASELLHLLCVRAVAGFDEEVVWIDGGNAVEPYTLGAICRRLGLDRRDILSRVNVARAFTAYQFVSLVEERLEEEVARSTPAAVIVTSATDLFMDKDMKWMESYQLLRRCADVVARVTEEHETITLVTAHTPGRGGSDPRMTALLSERSDEVVQIRTRRDGLLFRLPKRGRSMVFAPRPWNQATLAEFGEG
jgi:hypothetical protein